MNPDSPGRRRVGRPRKDPLLPATANPPEAEKERKKPVRLSKIQETWSRLPKGIVHRLVTTSAQDDTPVFKPFFDNLVVFAEEIGAQFKVGPFTYQVGMYEDHAAATAVYAPELAPYLDFDRVHLTDDLLWVGDANVLPTTANPLGGWTTANKGQHVVIPHARVALESIPRMQGQPPRFAYSTGCVTQPSYTPRASGRKALFHHTYAALIIEIDIDGEVFFRHINANADGSFQDFDILVKNGKIEKGPRLRAAMWGDIHYEMMEPVVAMTTWGYDMKKRKVTSTSSLLDWLQPEYQFFEDTLDFRRRNHHNIKDPHTMALVVAAGSESVEDEVTEAVSFANACRRPWCQSVVVESNHDTALAKWLKDLSGAIDVQNAYYWHRLNSWWHEAIRDREEGFNVVEEAMVAAGLHEDIYFVPSGGSFLVDDVECGMHGDLGTGGSRGSPNQYRKMGPKTSSGHTHTPKIVEGVYVAGVSAKLDQGYNKGPTTWAHAHILQYQGGKRTIICLSEDGRFRATGDQKGNGGLIGSTKMRRTRVRKTTSTRPVPRKNVTQDRRKRA
jgi:hypothetical protein